MARQEMLMARCDRKECNTVIEIDRSTEAPEGWLQIRVEIAGKWDGVSKLEFCSEKCVSIWARNRQKADVHSNGNPPPNYREEVLAAIEILVANNQDDFTKDNISEIAEIDPSTAGTWLRKLTEEEFLKIISGKGKRGSPFVYAKV